MGTKQFMLSRLYSLTGTLILVASLLLPGKLSAQENLFNVQHFTSRDGLHDLVVNNMVTDASGVLWVGTDNGLYRYVNGRFELFHEESVPFHLAGHNVSSLLLDSKGRIWVGDRLKGISVIDPQKGSSEIIPNLGPDALFSGREVDEMLESPDGHIWASIFPNKIIEFSPELKPLNTYTFHPASLKEGNQQVMGLGLAPDESILFFTFWEGTYRIRRDHKDFEKLDWFTPDTIVRPCYNAHIRKITSTHALLEYNSTYVLVDFASQKTRILAVTDSYVMQESICNRDKTGKYWFLKYPHILQFSSEGDLLTHYRVQLPRSLHYQHFEHKNAWIDDSYIAWFGTNLGMLKVDLKRQSFKKLTSGTEGQPLICDYTRCIQSVPDTSLLLSFVNCNYFDAVRLDRENGPTEVKHHPLPLGEGFGPEYRMRGNYVLTSTRYGRFIATYNGIFRQDNTHSIPRHVDPVSGPNQGEDMIWTILELDPEQLLLGSRQAGLFLYFPGKNTINPLKIHVINGEWPPAVGIWENYTDSRGHRFLLTSEGLYRLLSIKDGTANLEYVAMIGHYSVWSMTEAQNGEYWVGTVEEGLFVLDPSLKTVDRFSFTNGLKTATITNVIRDQRNRVWVSSTHKLYCIDPDQRKIIREFGVKDGIIDGGFNQRSAAMDVFGRLYFGTKNGVIHFHPDKTLEKYPRFEYRSFLLFSMTDEQGNLSRRGVNSPIRLEADKRNLSLEPIVADYTHESDNAYRYRLSGFERNWNELKSSQPRITYLNLPPGNYTLEVEGFNAQGNKTLNSLKIPVSVDARYWETTWFLVLLVCILAGILISIVYLKLSNSRYSQKLLESQLDSLRSQMNPHFFFNALNSIQDFIFHREREKASNYMSGFAKLLRNILDNSGRNFISLEEEERLLRQYLQLESLRFDGLLNWEIVVDPDIRKSEVTLPSMLVQPLIENAIKHGLSPKRRDMRLRIHFYETGKSLHCEVTDNGVGRSVSEGNSVHISKGLSIINRRLSLLGKKRRKRMSMEISDLKDHTGQPIGTKVHLKFN